MPIRLPYSSLCICAFVGLLLAVLGCGNPENELKKRLRTGAGKDAAFDATEWKAVTDWVEENPEALNEFVTNGKADCGKLKTYAAELLKKPAVTAPCGGATALRPAVRVFLENSESMDGYVQGRTDFEANLVRLLADLNGEFPSDKPRVYFIDSENIHEHRLPPAGSFTTSLRSFVGSLEPTGKNPWAATGGPSELNQILNLVLENTDPNDLSVLVSDFIYALEPGRSPSEGLQFAKSNTYSAFKGKARNTATLVWQLQSRFNGKYYTMAGQPKSYAGPRPYYVWFIGAPEVVRQVMNGLNTSNYEGYQNRLAFFPNAGGAAEPFATVIVLEELGKQGDFQLDTKDKNRLTLRNVNPALGPIQFSLAVDLSQVPADEAYRTDPKNYQTSSGFRVTKVEKITDDLLSKFSATGAGNSAKRRLQTSSATHLLTLGAQRNFPMQPVTIRLNDQLPAWVAASHASNDSAGPNANQTFGLMYLIEGVSQAYKPAGVAPTLARFTVKLN